MAEQGSEEGLGPNMFRPPIARGMQALDRSIFQKVVPLKAARVFDNKNISKIRSQLDRSKDALQQDRLANVCSDPDPERGAKGKKCVILRPEVQQMVNGEDAHVNGDTHETSRARPHSPTVTELVKQELISVIPYNLHLDYNYWTYHDIISSVLPIDMLDEIPSGFSQVGHVVHLNLREAYLPYKNLIAEILIDKNPGARTVINKIDDVGEENEFRTFRYEVLVGPDDLNVVASEQGCDFKFDYAKVYWNPRLSTEHTRMVDLFQEGEAVCDVMAGIGPFAIPAGKKQCFVWANDLNPDSYSSLVDAVSRNKVGDYVRPTNQDGRTFIRDAAQQLFESEKQVEIKKKISRKEMSTARPEILKVLHQPKTFQHFVLNLPASAITFLSSFIGIYHPFGEKLQSITPPSSMPLIHVYCFSTKDEQQTMDSTANDCSKAGDASTSSEHHNAEAKICAEISQQLQYDNLRPGKMESKDEVEIWDVRDVAPKKRMFCASFRLPEEVAFRDPRDRSLE